jgi:hypothetical protein
MRLKLTILLLILNAALFGLIYYMEKNTPEYELYEPLVFPAGVVENAVRLEINSNTLNQAWVMETRPEGWTVVEPITWPANPFAATRILNQLQFLEKQARFSVAKIENAGQTLEQYGLADPKASITIHHPGGLSTIKIGEPTGIGNRLYILSPDEEEVFVVNRELLESISIDVEDLRSEEIFRIPLFEVRSLRMTITNPGNLTVRLAREKNQWKFETPIETAADTSRVEAMLNSLTRLNVLSFEAVDPVRQGLDDATVHIRLTLEGNNRRQTILVGNPVPDDDSADAFYAQLFDNPTVFTVPAAPFNDLLEAQEALRERVFVQIDTNLVDGVVIQSGSSRVVLQKLESQEWQIPVTGIADATTRWRADTALITGLLDAIANLEAAAFISDAPAEADLIDYGFADPQRIVTVHTGSGTTRVLILGDLDAANGRVYAKMQSQPFVYQVEPDILGVLQVRPLYYRNRVLQAQPSAASVMSLRLIRIPEGKTVFSVPGANTGETGATPDPFTSDALGLDEKQRAAIRTIRDSVLHFEVNSYLSSRFITPHHSGDQVIPWKFRLDAEIVLPGGEQDEVRPFTFFFSDRLGASTQIGGSPQLNANFDLSQDLVDALFAITFDREPISGPVVSAPREADLETSPEQDDSTEVKPGLPVTDEAPDQ